MYGQALNVDLEQLRSLDPASPNSATSNPDSKLLNCYPPGMSITQLKGLIAVYKTQAAMPYRPTAKYDGRITFLHASEEEDGSDGVSAALHLEWEPFTTQSVDLHIVPGNHYTMMRLPHVIALSAQLNAAFDAALD
ncbi:MAG: hypothetical protein HC778_00440 [Chamaesiphon sp. CSU_1_12]|nr:hypothetical protein [Chamaesiphon sp. CSU_1_12]